MRFNLTIESDNAAFGAEQWGPGPEIARILHELAHHLDPANSVVPGDRQGTVRDLNGNTVGNWQITT